MERAAPRLLRRGINGHGCDLLLDVPADLEGVKTLKPLWTSTYAFGDAARTATCGSPASTTRASRTCASACRRSATRATTRRPWRRSAVRGLGQAGGRLSP
jgi:hypothetical protein